MKILRIFCGLLFTAMAFTACQQNKTSTEQEQGEQSYQIVQPLITYVAANDSVLAEEIKQLAAWVMNPTRLNSEVDFDHFFEQRDQLADKLSNIIASKEDADVVMIQDSSPATDAIINALAYIGMQPVGAEGMFGSLVPAPVLTARLQEVASAPYIMYHEFLVKMAGTVSEYPYLELSAESEMLVLAEKMIKEYPEHSKVAAVKKELRFVVTGLVDFHELSYEGQQSFHAGSLCMDSYPCLTDINFHNRFTETYPGSVFSKSISKQLATPSTLNMDLRQDSTLVVYALVEKIFTNYEDALDHRIETLLQGTDLMHVLSFLDLEQKQVNATCFRYFTERDKAERLLAQYQSKGATLKTLRFSSENFQWAEFQTQ